MRMYFECPSTKNEYLENCGGCFFELIHRAAHRSADGGARGPLLAQGPLQPVRLAVL